MKPDEAEIERLAYRYFVETQKNSTEAGNELLEAIYKNKLFVFKIVSRAASNYSNIVSDLQDFKHEVVIKTFEQACRNFDYEKGNQEGAFIRYLSKNLKLNAQNILKSEMKDENQPSINNLINSGNGDAVYVDSIDAGVNIEDDVIGNDQADKLLKQLLSSINHFYLHTKAGQQNKSAVYTYFVLECILPKPKAVYEYLISAYDFLKAQKDVLDEIRRMYFIGRHIPDQKEFSKLTGCAESKFANMRAQLTDFLQNDDEMRAVAE